MSIRTRATGIAGMPQPSKEFMHCKHRIKAVPSLVVMVAASLAGCQSAKAPEASVTTAAPAAVSQVADLDIVDAWSYLYGRYLVLQQENRDINVDKVATTASSTTLLAPRSS